MIDLNTRPGNVTGHTAAGSLWALGKAAKGTSSGHVGPKMSLVKQGDAAQDGTAPTQVYRIRYMPSGIIMDEKGCTVCFSNSDGERWDASEMTGSEWEFLRESVAQLANAVGLDPERLPIYLVPPSVTQRMNLDDAYAQFILGRLQGGTPGHRLVVDEKGCFTDLDAGEVIKVPPKDDQKDFWKARLERQAEYMRYVQQARMDHAQEVTREFAALRGFAQGSETARRLSGGSGESAAELLTTD